MPWTAQERELVFEDFWPHMGGQQGRCPRCNAVFDYGYSQLIGNYSVLARCPRGCGDLNYRIGNDPKRATFRDWTEEEGKSLVEAHYVGDNCRCPVDGAPLDAQRQTNGKVFIQCPRCMRHYEEVRQ